MFDGFAVDASCFSPMIMFGLGDAAGFGLLAAMSARVGEDVEGLSAGL
jgi:hypothetical protein